mgnify:CR=1 FL=1
MSVFRSTMKVAFHKPVCVECGRMGVATTGAVLFPNQPHISTRVFFVCPCGAWTGSHEGTALPRGRPGNALTRQMRALAHEAFDPIWRRSRIKKRDKHRKDVRSRAYRWLAGELGIDIDDCHIGLFDAAMCEWVIQVCGERLRRAA